MVHDIKVAIAAINKWLYYGWNYESVNYKWTNHWGEEHSEHVPTFIIEVNWTVNIDHIISKWHYATSQKDPDAYLVKFYATLDNNNRERLLEWVIKNYSNESRIFTDEPVINTGDTDKLDDVLDGALTYPSYLSESTSSACMYKAGICMGKAAVIQILTDKESDESEVNRLANKALRLNKIL